MLEPAIGAHCIVISGPTKGKTGQIRELHNFPKHRTEPGVHAIVALHGYGPLFFDIPVSRLTVVDEPTWSQYDYE